ncbi:MAG TPA: NAD(P)H-hydrate epimerase [Ardenticatenaceae bacterium]|nr:NAD(P)H-hydrate epimerase [Ardenticatenaceae bacterium]
MSGIPEWTTHIPAITVAQMREVDRLMTEVYGVTLLQMMENAGRALAELTRRRLGGSVAGHAIVVLAGKGNTGASGLAAARHLRNWGGVVQVVLASPPPEMNAAAGGQLVTLEEMGIPVWGYGAAAGSSLSVRWSDASVLIDALLGCGLVGDPRGAYADLIRVANASRRPIVSLDVPSGLDATDGTIYSPTVQATATLTLALPKQGLVEGWPVVGELSLADIGVPPALFAEMGLHVGPIFERDSIVSL